MTRSRLTVCASLASKTKEDKLQQQTLAKAGHSVCLLVFGAGLKAQLRAQTAAGYTTAMLNECTYAMNALTPGSTASWQHCMMQSCLCMHIPAMFDDVWAGDGQVHYFLEELLLLLPQIINRYRCQLRKNVLIP